MDGVKKSLQQGRVSIRAIRYLLSCPGREQQLANDRSIHWLARIWTASLDLHSTDSGGCSSKDRLDAGLAGGEKKCWQTRSNVDEMVRYIMCVRTGHKLSSVQPLNYDVSDAAEIVLSAIRMINDPTIKQQRRRCTLQ